MTRITRLLFATGAVALGATTLVGAGLAGDRGWGGHHGRGHHGGGFGGGAGLFETFDANDDGTLTQAEIDEVRQSRLAEFDQNGDGNLSLDEYQALWMDAMRERMVDRFQAHDDDGDGIVTAAEFAEPFDRIVSRLDRDDDGELTRDELRRRGEGRGGPDQDDDRPE